MRKIPTFFHKILHARVYITVISCGDSAKSPSYSGYFFLFPISTQKHRGTEFSFPLCLRAAVSIITENFT